MTTSGTRYVIFRADNGRTLKTVTGEEPAALIAKHLANELNTRVGVCKDEERAVYFSPTKGQS